MNLTRLKQQGGMVTAELALTFPAVILIVVALGLTAAAGIGQVQVNSASRAACRAMAIDGDPNQAAVLGQRLLGKKGTVQVSNSSTDILCTAHLKLPQILGFTSIEIKSEAVMPREDSW